MAYFDLASDGHALALYGLCHAIKTMRHQDVEQFAKALEDVRSSNSPRSSARITGQHIMDTTKRILSPAKSKP